MIQIPARSGKAVCLNKGQGIKIINVHGHQVVDTWAFNQVDLDECISNEHMRQKLNSIFPKKGEPLFTNKRRPILIFEEDTSPGVHDTIMAACDIYRYQQLGCSEYHENCTDNLHKSMAELQLKIMKTPSPLNLWMNIPVSSNGSCGWEAPVSAPGDYVVLRAVFDCVVAMSACPQDLIPINAGKPVEAFFEILD